MSLYSRTLWVTVVFALFVMSSAAQSLQVGATIPFEFEASNAVLPAGDYVVVRDMPSVAILIHSKDRKHQVLAMPSINMIGASQDAPEFKLVFVRYQNGQQTRNFLRSVWYGWNGLEMAESRAERNAEAGVQIAAGTRTEVVVYARNLR